MRQRELGMRLRELRNGLDLTVEEVAEQLLCSATKISRLETGTRRASLRDVRDLCRIYHVTDQAVADELMNLAEAGTRAWLVDQVRRALPLPVHRLGAGSRRHHRVLDVLRARTATDG